MGVLLVICLVVEYNTAGDLRVGNYFSGKLFVMSGIREVGKGKPTCLSFALPDSSVDGVQMVPW